jgi:hypothetical protein
MTDDNANIEVEITGPEDFHCFRLILRAAPDPEHRAERQPIEIMLHARALIELIYKGSSALADWQMQGTALIMQRLTAGSQFAPPDLAFFAEMAMLAQTVARFDWRTSVTEEEHFERIAAMNKLRAALDQKIRL